MWHLQIHISACWNALMHQVLYTSQGSLWRNVMHMVCWLCNWCCSHAWQLSTVTYSQGRTCSPWWCKTHYRAESFSDIYWLSKSKHLLLISVNAAWPPPSLPGDLRMEVKEDQRASDDPRWESTKSLSLKQTVFSLKCAVHEYFYFDNISY